MNPKKIIVPEGFSGRVDKTLAILMPDYSREVIKKWIIDNNVLVNGCYIKNRHNVKYGDVITVYEQPLPESLSFTAEDVAFEVLEENSDWLIVNKPAGLVTHPGSGNWSGTLLNGLLYRYPELFIVPRAGIVHRLDKNTSGIMIVARTLKSQIYLVRQLQLRFISREYIAIVQGSLLKEGTINKTIGRDINNPIKMSAANKVISPKEAVTHFRSIVHGLTPCQRNVTKIKCILDTGRTHQIRVHLSSIGHPLLGDSVYNGQFLSICDRPMLHSEILSFVNEKGNKYTFSSPIPSDMHKVLDKIKWIA
ncbi:ribosomal large subunit pseudouridine synthase D [Candidatus Kinetoplastibacterium desouzaii TCC079E]|uniref:Pseudouridine synthase n=1 Tax=Candidatus Kinetoplastidibacterium desouzai TCC079E TaxID=1208919 RepID=M1LUJ6_9PROT|nr:RluA family pseudouridine synthase [Candidatus Kinetoplastibacterium desouzaii]AGF46984.1 ribosomal large subunit pseudouridine synthase D [Candidatus Kinetoplastibacterium desouzaii TCC079E]